MRFGENDLIASLSLEFESVTSHDDDDDDDNSGNSDGY